MAVILQDDGDAYDDTRAMLDYVFENFSGVLLSEQEKPDEVTYYDDAGAYVLLPEGIGFSDLEYEIQVEDEKEASGEITFYYAGQNVGSAAVKLTPEYVEKATGYTTRLRLVEDPESRDGSGTGEGIFSPGRWAPVAGVALLFLAAAVLIGFRLRAAKSEKLRKARRRRRQSKKRRRVSGRDEKDK